MFSSPRISTRHLAGLCRRVAISLDAGIDLRTIWAREADHAAGFWGRQRLKAVSQAVAQGEALPEALAAAGAFFPPLVREIVEVGDQSGRLAEAFAQLAEHYEGQLALRRGFLAALSWPLIELAITLVVIGVLIYVPATIARSSESPVDFLGIGLVGAGGLVSYLIFLAAAGIGFYLFLRACQRGALWTRPIQRFLWYLPGISTPLRLLTLARLTWAMHLTFNTGMDVRRALRLSLQSTHNAHVTDRLEGIQRAVAAGDSLYEAFRDTGAFPAEFLDAVQVGEQSGRLVEAMGRLSAQYRSRAEAALTTSSTVAALLIWVVIALLIITIIFRVFSVYIGIIRAATP
ncbi:MAG: type II secretion system F family protein [Thermoguttaceae bacterium]